MPSIHSNTSRETTKAQVQPDLPQKDASFEKSPSVKITRAKDRASHHIQTSLYNSNTIERRAQQNLPPAPVDSLQKFDALTYIASVWSIRRLIQLPNKPATNQLSYRPRLDTCNQMPDTNSRIPLTYNFPWDQRGITVRWDPQKPTYKYSIPFSEKFQNLTQKHLKTIEQYHPLAFEKVPDSGNATLQFMFVHSVAGQLERAIGFVSDFPSFFQSIDIAIVLDAKFGNDTNNIEIDDITFPDTSKDNTPVPHFESTLLHEIGHGLGLRHTHPEFSEFQSIMSYDVSYSMKELGPVDHALLDCAYGSLVNDTEMGFVKGTNSTYYVAKNNVDDNQKTMPAEKDSPFENAVGFGGVAVLGLLGAYALKRVIGHGDTSSQPPAPPETELTDI